LRGRSATLGGVKLLMTPGRARAGFATLKSDRIAAVHILTGVLSPSAPVIDSRSLFAVRQTAQAAFGAADIG
jgi:hypothetical protein